MKNVNKNNSFLAYILILLSFFVLIFFTKNFYKETQVLLDETESVTQKLEKVSTDLSKMQSLSQKLQNDSGEERELVNPLLEKVSESALLEHFYSYAQEKNQDKNTIVYRSIDFSPETINDLGFKQIQINISALFAWENTLLSFMNFITSSNSRYTFYVEDFDYPMNEAAGNISASIPLVVYYK